MLSLLERAQMTEHTIMILIALIIGVLAGFGAIGIRTLIHTISELSFMGEGTLLENIASTPWYFKIIVPTIGGLLVGPLIYHFAPEAKGHGVPEVMQSIILKGGVIRPRVALVKALASSITIGSGGSVGREGPIIQIGASLGSTVGQFFRVSTHRMKTLVGCGAAAGIAAAFNAPIAGALFAVEIILMDFAVAQFSPIVISSVMATVISHQFEGNFAAFQVPSYELINPWELILYGVLGVLSGLVSYLFIKVLYSFEDIFDENIKIPEYLQPAFGGIVIGILAIFFPQIMGVGYDSINLALHGEMALGLAFVLIFLKILSTSVTLGSGGSGGIFAPSLFMGAMVGVFFGKLIENYVPMVTASPGAYALVAMGGLVAGTTRAPITAIIIVFELTNDYDIILPLMITCIISMILSSKLSRESIYTLKLLQRKINLREGTEVNLMKSIFVRNIFKDGYESIPENSKFREVVTRVTSNKDPYLVVENPKNEITGVISIHDIKNFIFDSDDLQDIIIAKDVARKSFTTVTIENNCQEVIDKMRDTEMFGLPVVDSANSKKVIGMVWRKEVLDAYHKEIEQKELISTLADKIHHHNTFNADVHFMDGYAISEFSIPESMWGESIQSLHFRKNYSVDILTIRQHNKEKISIIPFPGADYIFKPGDSAVVAGEIQKISLLKNTLG
jgi:CIC family chloride channel protein